MSDWQISQAFNSLPIFFFHAGSYSALILPIWADCESWLGQRSPSGPVQACLSFLDCSHPAIPCNFSASSFVLSDLWFVARWLRRPQDFFFFFFLNKGVRGFTQTQMWSCSSPAFTHIYCSLWPKQLVFVVKRLIRKKTLLCWCSWIPPLGQQQLSCDKLPFPRANIIFNISGIPTKL